MRMESTNFGYCSVASAKKREGGGGPVQHDGGDVHPMHGTWACDMSD